jgi:hypothetical protein
MLLIMLWTFCFLKLVICWLLCDRSGEEGHFPQLTQCAETRLRQIAPESRVLRTEEPTLTKSTLEPEHWDKVSNDIEVWVCTLYFCVCEQVASETVAGCLWFLLANKNSSDVNEKVMKKWCCWFYVDSIQVISVFRNWCNSKVVWVGYEVLKIRTSINN